MFFKTKLETSPKSRASPAYQKVARVLYGLYFFSERGNLKNVLEPISNTGSIIMDFS